MKTPLKVLVVEDREADAIMLMLELNRGGFNPDYLRVETGADMKKALLTQEWDLILADFKLPEFSGPEALQIYKESGKILPFITVSGTLSEEAAVDSLKAGAHDFISKTNLARLVPAVKRELLNAKIRRERIHMKKSVFESETMFELLMDGMSEGACIVKDFRFINANPSLEKIMGVPPGTLIGRSTCEFLKYDEGEVLDLRKRQLGDGVKGNYELEITRLSGEKRQLLITETVVPSVEEDDDRLFIVAYDFTERKQMINSLRKSEERFRDVALSSSDWVWEINATGHYTYCSDKVIDLLGYTSREIIGRTPFEFMPADAVADVADIFNKLVADKRPIRDLKNRIITKDGFVITVMTSAVPILNEEGELLGYRGLDKDITQSELVKTALEQRTDELDGRVKELDCLYGISDYLTRFGATLADTLQGIVELVSSGWRCPAQAVARIRVGDSEFRSANFQESECRQAAPMKQDDHLFGEIEVFILKRGVKETEDLFLEAEQNLLNVIAQRISSYLERRRIASKLQQNEARTRAITDTARDAIIILNNRGEVNFWNPGAEKMFGYTQQEIYGQELHQLLIPGTFQEEFYKAFQSLQKNGVGKAVNKTMELRAICKNGDEIPVELSLGSVRIDDEWQVVGMMRDLTERKKADMERQQANKMESIGTLAAGIAHEINTPTQFVGNNLRFLQDSFSDITEVLVEVNGLIESSRECGDSNGELDALGEKVQQADLDFLVEEIPASIEQSQKGIETVSRIVGSMRAFTHPGKDEKTPSDLNRIIKDTIIVSRSEWKYDANIEIDLMESLPTVPCCPGAFGQIMLNLITNASHAIKSAHESSISSESSSEVKFAKGLIRITTTQQDQYAIIKISDDGTGIPEAIQKRIFDPFFTTKDVGQGTGQGLSLVHSVVVENLRGQIAFDTEQGKGTTFTINLPLESNLQEAHS